MCIRDSYEPNPENVKRYEDAFRTWQQIYKSLSTGAFDQVVAFQDKYR